jgi:hypothetical protein
MVKIFPSLRITKPAIGRNRVNRGENAFGAKWVERLPLRSKPIE